MAAVAEEEGVRHLGEVEVKVGERMSLQEEMMSLETNASQKEYVMEISMEM